MQETKAEDKKQKSDQESRECNLNIHRAPESQNLNAEARSENDCTFFYDRCRDAFNLYHVRAKGAIRPGRKLAQPERSNEEETSTLSTPRLL